ncbi:hypothetical protein DS2_03870 [Catenovulum agarivorans DS-2]|uniref:Uncharacterized protein n=1 Tax=Catenovulum agarivorans DS-2 TaxID=1328313 RepID=W7QID8_9ALTE|nr:hypothetical protein [Catenovulum agarivorans]EWH11616.1 hypothetical protein DS2_03870 [Catenovulum agarivorans DS-2]
MEQQPRNTWLITGAALSAIAAVMHLACLYFGAPLFRFLGTEAMAQMYESGNYAQPIIACVVLASILLTWSAYALSGAGVIRKLPLLRLALICITGVYLARALFFPLIMPYFPENSMLFWLTSSGVVFVFGAVHLIGFKKMLSRKIQ